MQSIEAKVVNPSRRKSSGKYIVDNLHSKGKGTTENETDLDQTIEVRQVFKNNDQSLEDEEDQKLSKSQLEPLVSKKSMKKTKDLEVNE